MKIKRETITASLFIYLFSMNPIKELHTFLNLDPIEETNKILNRYKGRPLLLPNGCCVCCFCCCFCCCMPLNVVFGNKQHFMEPGRIRFHPMDDNVGFVWRKDKNP